MSYPFNTSLLRSQLRRWRPWFIAAPFVVILATPFLFDWAVKTYLERYGTLLNGAEVNIDRFNFSLLQGKATIRGIQVTHHTQSSINLVEIDEVNFDFERQALLSRRLVIPQMKILGIRLNKPRERSGYVDMEEFHPLPPTALMDRIAPGVYDSARASLGESPLRSLAQISLAQAARARLDSLAKEFPAYHQIKGYQANLDNLIVDWDRSVENLENNQSAQALIAKVQEQAVAFAQNLEKTQTDLEIDMGRILAKKGLAPLQEADLTPQLIGKRALNHLERLAYWIEVSRRKLPTEAMMTAGGVPVAAQPRIEIRNIAVLSQADGSPYQGAVDGTITSLSTLPVGRKNPVRIDIRADFPGLQIQGLKLSASVDHTRLPSQEDLRLDVQAFPLKQWELEKSSDFNFILKSGVASLGFESRNVGQETESKWQVTVNEPRFEIQSKSLALNSSLQETLAPFSKTLDLSGSASGTLHKIELQNQSALGRELATSIGIKYFAALRGIEEATQDQLRSRFIPALRQLKDRLEVASTQTQNRIAANSHRWDSK